MKEEKKSKSFWMWLVWALVVIGALNWGLVGFFNWNLVDALFGKMWIARGIYMLVGLAGLVKIFYAFKEC